MLIAAEDFIVIERDERFDIIYSPYSNKILAMEKSGTEIFRQLTNTCKEREGLDRLYEIYDRGDIDFLLDILVKNKMIFLNADDLKKADHSLYYKENNMFHLHKAYLHLTQNCNLKCKYCYNAGNLGRTKDMTTKQWKNVIQKLKKEAFDYIVFTGGEVFLRKDLMELTRYVKKLDMVLHILTNGTFIIPQEILAEVDKIEISLDSIDEVINDENRVNPKRYSVYKNILEIPKAMRNKVVIKSVLSKSNFDTILEMKKELKGQGFDNMEIILQQPNSIDEVDIYPENILPRELHKFDGKMISKCNACYEIMAINADGKIYPCQALIKDELEMGSIFDKNWKEKIKNSPLTKVFMEDDITTSDCKKCSYRYICGGPCKAVSYNVSKSLYEGRGAYCRRAKLEAEEYLKSIEFGEGCL